MGLFDSIFGGGGGNTTVTQVSNNKTDVTLTSQIANVIDLEALAQAVTAMGDSVKGALTGTAEQTQALIASLSSAQIVTQIAAVQEKAELNDFLKDASKIALLVGGGYFVWRKVL